jgi:hypothetical protein
VNKVSDLIKKCAVVAKYRGFGGTYQQKRAIKKELDKVKNTKV